MPIKPIPDSVVAPYAALEADTALSILERRYKAITDSIEEANERCVQLHSQLNAEQTHRAKLAITKASIAGAINRLREDA